MTLDWTSEDGQHLLIVSLVVGRRGLPNFWRADAPSVLKGRMKRYERAVIKRAFKLIFQWVAPRRVRLTADRGFLDDGLFALFHDLQINFILRVMGDADQGLVTGAPNFLKGSPLTVLSRTG